jgi:hypothetical protein
MERWSLTSSRFGLLLALSLTLLAIGGCGGTSGSPTAENAQAKALVERALDVVVSEYQDFHNYTLVSPYTLKNFDHSLRAVPSLQATGGMNTFTVAVRSASGTTFEVDGDGQRIARVCRPPSSACPARHWAGSSTLIFPPVTPVARLTGSQEAEVRSILLANLSHYAQLLSRGQVALGTAQYPNAQAGLNAFSDPDSAANRFSAYQKDANLAASASYVDAFNRADRLFTAANANEPQAMTNWEGDMAQVQGDLAQWITDATSWQISEIQASVLQADVARFDFAFAKARADGIRATPGVLHGAASFSTLATESTTSPKTANGVPPNPAGRCPDVEFRSPYTDALATARVAVRGGTATCAAAQALIRAAFSVKVQANGETWQWSVDGWICSSGGDGTTDICTHQGNKVIATTPTPGGFWPEP